MTKCFCGRQHAYHGIWQMHLKFIRVVCINCDGWTAVWKLEEKLIISHLCDQCTNMGIAPIPLTELENKWIPVKELRNEQ